MMRKTAAVSNYKGRKLYTHATCVVNSCHGKVDKSFILIKVLNSTKYSGIVYDSSFVVEAIFNLGR